MAGNLVVRAAHDLGAAAWFGGSLMGAIGLNGAAAAATDPRNEPGFPRSGGHVGRPCMPPPLAHT